MKMPVTRRPPTANMIAALEHLAQTGDRVLVRTYSQWWIRESDSRGAEAMLREVRDLSDRLNFTGSWLTDAKPMVVVPTSTVKAMAARGILKMTGPKRFVISGSAKRKDHWSAELTPVGTALREELENRAQSTYDSLLRKVRTKSN